MKAILFVSLLFILGEPHQQDDLVAAIDKSNFVGFIYHNRNAPSEDLVFTAVEVFKGDVKYLIARNGEMNIIDERLYLVIGNVEGHFLSTLNFPARVVIDLPRTTLDILQRLPCYDDSIKKEYENLICTRELDPVCGCDNKKYGNMCEMRKQGIVKFKPGNCK